MVIVDESFVVVDVVGSVVDSGTAEVGENDVDSV